MAQAVQDPKLFRQLDRQLRFDAVLLVGEPAQARPLIEHLLDTKDWVLTYLDHTSLLFKRGAAEAWRATALRPFEAQFPHAGERARFLALAATKLLAVRMPDEAKEVLIRAESLDSRAPEVWSGFAALHMARGEWVAALEKANQALKLDKDSLSALAVKTQTLYATRKFSEALPLSGQLIKRQPNDPALLFYHARIAHDARAYRTEIEALTKLIDLAERNDRPVSGYRIYLAQAYAADGQAEPAIAEFARVLSDPKLSKEQRRFAEETLAQVKSRSRF